MPRPIAPPPPEDFHMKKKGFKCDRVQRYRDKQTAKRNGKVKQRVQPECVKEIKFDTRDRTAFLATFRNSKEKRRAKATEQKKKALKRKNKTQRQDLRETARQTYNMSMHVPINPDFTLTLPGVERGAALRRADGTAATDKAQAKTVVYSNNAVVTTTPFQLPRNGPISQ